jgi:hypothetical protein
MHQPIRFAEDGDFAVPQTKRYCAKAAAASGPAANAQHSSTSPTHRATTKPAPLFTERWSMKRLTRAIQKLMPPGKNEQTNLA